jgi:hypothetical protein
MPFTFVNYGTPTFEQSNPLLAGIKYGAGIGNDLLQAIQRALENQKAQAELPYAGELAKSTAAYKNAMAKYLESPTQALRNLTPLGKQYLEPGLLPKVSSYYGGSSNIQGVPQQNTYQDEPSNQYEYGTNNIPSNNESERQTTYRRQRELETTDPVIRRQANDAQQLMLLSDKIDTKPLEEFAGLGGKLKLSQERAKGALSSLGFDTKPSDEFRKYTSFSANEKYIIMDMVRKALKTSISPGYVMNTLAPLLNPEAPIWNDPAQVRANIEGFKDILRDYAEQTTSSMSKGVPMTLNEAKKRYEESKKENLENSIKTAHSKAGVKSLAKKIELPNLPEREFRAWFIRQPRMVRDAIRMKLGEQ